MKRTITTTSQTLAEVLGARYTELLEDKDQIKNYYVLTIQNLGASNIFLEN
jgi:hypothetical protein